MSKEITFREPEQPEPGPTPPKRDRTEWMAQDLRAAAGGEPRWATRPYGYDRDATGVHKVPAEAANVERAVQQLLAGATLAAVCRGLNGEGVRTTAGKPWSPSTLRRLLLNPILAGEQVYRGKVIGRGTWEPILTRALQARLRTLLGDPARRTQHGTERLHLGSGLYLCGHEGCGGVLWSMGAKGVYICKDGGGHLQRKAEPVDAYVASVVPVMLARAEGRLPTPEQDQAELAELEERREALAGLVADGLVRGDAAREKATELTTRIHELELRLATPRPRRFFGRVAAAQREWDALTLPDQRDLLRAFVEITIQPLGRGVRAEPEQYVQITVKK